MGKQGRDELALESQFCGAIDGAMEFVKRSPCSCAQMAAVGAREDFGDVCHGPHLQGKEKKQHVLYDDRVQVLNWVAATFGWPCSTSGEYWNYLQAVKDFQRTYNTEGNGGHPREQLEVDGDFGPASWRAVFDCYQVHLAETLEITAEELVSLQGAVRGQFVKENKPLVGCGEYKPKEMAGLDNYRSQTNRRVEVLFFEAEDHLPETPCLAGDCDPGACELYDRRSYRRKRLTADLSLAMESLTVLVYQAGTTNPIEGAHVVLGGPCPGDGRTDALGLVTFDQLKAGEYVLTVSQAGYSQANMTVNVPYGQASTAQGDTPSFSPSESAKEIEQQAKGPSPNPPVAVPLASTITSLRIESVTFLSDHNLLNDHDKDYKDNVGAHIRPEWTVTKAQKNEQSSVSHTMDTEVTLEVELLVEPANASPHPLKLTGTASHGLIFTSKPEARNVRGGTNRIQLKSDKRLPKEIVDFNFEIEWSASYAQQAAASPPPPKPNPTKTTNWMFLTFGIPVVPSGRTGPTSDPDSPPRQGITRKRMIEATRAASAAELRRVLHNPSADPLDPHVIAEGLVMRFTVDPENNLKNEWELADASTGACYTIVRYTDAVMCMLGCPGRHRNMVVWAWVKSPDKPESNDAPYPNMHFVAHGQPRTQDYRTYGSPPDASKNHRIAWLDANGRNKFEAVLSLTHGATGTRLYAPGFGPKRTYREVLFSFEAMCWYDGMVKQELIYDYSAHQPP